MTRRRPPLLVLTAVCRIHPAPYRPLLRAVADRSTVRLYGDRWGPARFDLVSQGTTVYTFRCVGVGDVSCRVAPEAREANLAVLMLTLRLAYPGRYTAQVTDRELERMLAAPHRSVEYLTQRASLS